MASCNYCGTTILFGGKKAGDLRFCNDKCMKNGSALIVASQIPEDIVKLQAIRVYEGACPKCGKDNGPVDVHTSHHVWSALILTSWSSKPQVSCRSCGRKSQTAGLAQSFFLGWWGIPWGILVTPVQIIKNLFAIVYSPASGKPSEKLEQTVKLHIAQNVLAQQEGQKD